MNKEWKKALILMKEKREDDVMQKTLRRSESIKNKLSLSKGILQENQAKKKEESEEQKLKIQMQFEKLRDKNLKRINSIEIARKKTDLVLKRRMLKLSEGKLKNMEFIREKFLSRSTKSCENIKLNLKAIYDQKIEKQHEKAEKDFLKYTEHVICFFYLLKIY